MACMALVPARALRIDPSLTPALFASVGAFPERRAWFEVNDDAICCCLTTLLGATYSDLKTACDAADGMLAPTEAGLEGFRDATGLPFPVPYLMGLVNGWDGFTIKESNYDRIREADEQTLRLFENGRQDGMAAFAAVSAVLSRPAYPLASAAAFDLYATEDQDDDAEDEGGEEDFAEEYDDSEDEYDPHDSDPDEDDDWDDDDDV